MSFDVVRLHALPAASVLGIPTRIGPFIRTRLFSWPGKMRMGAELFVPPRRDPRDESIGAFMTRRFGREATTYLAEPLLAGIHAGDVDRLSVRALFPRFVDAERKHGSLLRAFRANARRKAHAPSSADPDRSAMEREASPERTTSNREPGTRNPEGAFKSLPGGLTEMVRALERAIVPANIRTNTPVDSVRGRGPFVVRTLSGESVEARSVVLAAPAYVVSQLLRDRDPEIADWCGEIPYASVATVALAFRRESVADPLNGSGFVVPRVEKTGIMAAAWLSSKWPNRAPEGRVLLRTFIGGARDPDALERSDAELIARSRRALDPLLGISGDPLFTRVYRWERANAQYEVGHLERMENINRGLARHAGVFVTGSGFRGVGIPDCVADGRVTAGHVAEWLAKHRSVTTEVTADERRSL